MITNETQNDLKIFGLMWKELHRSCSDMKIGMDYAAMKDYSLNEIKRAVITHKRDTAKGMFEPEPAHLIELIRIERRQKEFEENKAELSIEHQRPRSTDEFRAKAMLEISKILPGIKLGGDEDVAV